jgi:hypothetical protein
VSKLRTFDDLKDTIRAEISIINEELLQRVHSNVLDKLLAYYRSHMPDVILKI